MRFSKSVRKIEQKKTLDAHRITFFRSLHVGYGQIFYAWTDVLQANKERPVSTEHWDKCESCALASI